MSWISRGALGKESSQSKPASTQSQGRASSSSHSWSTQRHSITQHSSQHQSGNNYSQHQQQTLSLSSGFGLKIPAAAHQIDVGAAFPRRQSLQPSTVSKASEGLMFSVMELQRDVAKLKDICSMERTVETNRKLEHLTCRIESIESRLLGIEESCTTLRNILEAATAKENTSPPPFFRIRGENLNAISTSHRGARLAIDPPQKKCGQQQQQQRPSLLFIPAQVCSNNADTDETLSDAGDDLFA